MSKTNCWVVKKCGREQGGAKVAELGVCPAAKDASSNGINDGTNGGRICWAVAGTFCGGKVQGDFAQKQVSCMACEVFKMIKSEQADSFMLMKSGSAFQKASR